MSDQYLDQSFYGKLSLARIPEGKVLFVSSDHEIIGVDFPEQETDNPWGVAYGNAILAVNSNYIVVGSERYYLTLPAASVRGDRITILGDCQWRITQNEADVVRIGSQLTTLGVTGYVESSAIGDCISLICTSSNRWMAHPFSSGLLVL